MKPPHIEPRPHTTHHHGIERSDPWAWLKADNWQDVMRDPAQLPADIRACLEAENAWCAHELADTEAFQAGLFEELKGRIRQDDASVPAPEGSFCYYSRYEPGAQHPRFCRTLRSGSGIEQILLDGAVEAKGTAYFDLGGLALSPDHQKLAWSVDELGSERYHIRVRDLASGSSLDEAVQDSTGAIIWLRDGSGFYYVRVDENQRPQDVFLHRLGAGQDEDILVWRPERGGYFTSIGLTQSRRFLIISSHDHETSEASLLNLTEPGAVPRCIAPRRAELEYDAEDHEDHLIIRTNADGAEDFKLVTAPLTHPGPDQWQDLVPAQAGCHILSFATFKKWLVRLERESGLPRIVVRNMLTGEEHRIAFDEEAYSLGLGEMREYDTDTLRFTYSSMTTPSQTWDYDMGTRIRTLRKTQEVPSGHNPSEFETRRLFAPGHDGALIPVTLLFRKDTPRDGSAPLWLYGYGSYGISIPAAFSTNILSLVKRGFVYAIAHIRGGEEKGHAWYKAGKREFKTNTFRDFISVADFLVQERFTSRGKIVAEGGSAGGMLMGAVANMAPDRFGAIVAEVPFVDCLTTMLDASLPLTPPEWPEWGNPIESAEAYATIAAYAPYENITAQDYPPLLVLAGLTDPRVTYWEPAKWVARLRATKTGDAPLLLKTTMDAGHGGATGRFDRLKDTALIYAFGMRVMGAMSAP